MIVNEDLQDFCVGQGLYLVKDPLLSQCSKFQIWHMAYVFIQSFFERVAAGLGQFWQTNHFFVCLRSVNFSIKHYKHERKEFWSSLLSVEFLFMSWDCMPCHWWKSLHQSWINNFIRLQSDAHVSWTPELLCVVFGSLPEREKLPGHTVKYVQLCHKTPDLAFLRNSAQKGELDINSTVEV